MPTSSLKSVFPLITSIALLVTLVAPLPAVAEELASVNLPQQPLTSELMYKLLLAEIAGQRNRMSLSVNTYLDVLKKTHDPRIAERAVEVAVFAQNNSAALEAANLWVESDPESVNARQTLVGILVSAGRLEDSLPHLTALMKKAPDTAPSLFMNLHALFQNEVKKDKVLSLVEALAKPYRSMPEAQYALGLAALEARSGDQAREAIARALALKPGWESAALLEGQRLMMSKKAPAVILYYRQFLEKYPKSQEVRLMYARLLVEEKSYDAARAQFEELLKNAPNNPEMAFAVALLSSELHDLDRAITYFKQAASLNYREPDAIRYYLGQAYELKQAPESAVKMYLEVSPVSDQYVPARMRVADLYAKSNRLSEARELLHGLPVNNNEQRALVVQAEGQLLSDAGDLQTAKQVLTEGLKAVPDSIDLLYDRAMVFEKLDQLGDMETDLRKIIQLKPDHAHAYNALGYTLADRTTRYAEALELIQKAVKLAPEDAFILDSLGWVNFKLGHLDEASTVLKSAFERQGDPEIAAHLAEVMWARGDHAGAEKILSANLQQYPDNASLRQLDKRLHP